MSKYKLGGNTKFLMISGTGEITEMEVLSLNIDVRNDHIDVTSFNSEYRDYASLLKRRQISADIGEMKVIKGSDSASALLQYAINSMVQRQIDQIVAQMDIQLFDAKNSVESRVEAGLASINEIQEGAVKALGIRKEKARRYITQTAYEHAQALKKAKASDNATRKRAKSKPKRGKK